MSSVSSPTLSKRKSLRKSCREARNSPIEISDDETSWTEFREFATVDLVCTRITGPGKDGNDNVVEVVESLKSGRIAGLRRTGNGHYVICGEFGTVDIVAERRLLRPKAPWTGIPGQ